MSCKIFLIFLILIIFVSIFFSKVVIGEEYNSGEVVSCYTNEDCKGYSSTPKMKLQCLYCPIDTKAVIYIFENSSGSNKTVIKPGGRGYCAYLIECTGNWNGDTYKIISNNYNNHYKPNPLLELTQEVLEKWKSFVIRNVSEDYLKKHVDIDVLDVEVNIHDVLRAKINYYFKYDWVVLLVKEEMDIKRLVDGKWIWLDDNEIERSLNNNRRIVPTIYYTSSGEYPFSYSTAVSPLFTEINSIISREEAEDKIKQCNKDIKLKEVYLSDGHLMAGGDDLEANIEKCKKDLRNLFTNIAFKKTCGNVDLSTGEVYCSDIYDYYCGDYVSFKNARLYFSILILVIAITFIVLKIRRKWITQKSFGNTSNTNPMMTHYLVCNNFL